MENFNRTQSITYFILGCIPARLGLTYLAYSLNTENLRLFSYVLFAIAGGFLYLYFTGGRQNAQEAGGQTWWAKYRIIHGCLYLLAAIFAYQGNNDAYKILLLDTGLGAAFFVRKRF
jgi:hypothetical protein